MRCSDVTALHRDTNTVVNASRNTRKTKLEQVSAICLKFEHCEYDAINAILYDLPEAKECAESKFAFCLFRRPFRSVHGG